MKCLKLNLIVDLMKTFIMFYLWIPNIKEDFYLKQFIESIMCFYKCF